MTNPGGTPISALPVADSAGAGDYLVLNKSGVTSKIDYANFTLSVSAGISGLGSGIAAFLSTPSSANLRAAMTDESGTGDLLFAGGALGTPASGTLTNCSLPASALTGASLAPGVTGSSLTSVGTIASGTWHGTAIGTQYGGLGADNSAASGVPLFASGAVTVTGTSGTGNFVRAASPTVSGLTLTGITTVPANAVLSSSNGTLQLQNSGSSTNEILWQHNGTDGYNRTQAGSYFLGCAGNTTVALTPTNVTLSSGVGLTVPGVTTLSSALTYGGVTLSNSVTGAGSMVLNTSPTFLGSVISAGNVLVGSGSSGRAAVNFGDATHTGYFSWLDGTLTRKAYMGFDTGNDVSLNFDNAGAKFNVNGALATTGALTYGGVTLSNAVTGNGNMVLSAGPTLTGTTTVTNVSSGTTSGGYLLTQGYSYFYSNVGGANPSSGNGLGIGWNQGNGTAEVNLVNTYSTGATYNPIYLQGWNGTAIKTYAYFANSGMTIGAGLGFTVSGTTSTAAINATGNLTITKSNPGVQLTGTEPSAKTWTLVESGGNFIAQDTTDGVNSFVLFAGAAGSAYFNGTGGVTSGGPVTVNGSSSGAVTIKPQSAAGIYNFNLPTTAGTAGQVLTSQGGGSSAMTWSSAVTQSSGTWTPTLTGGTSGAATLTAASGYYINTGTQWTAWFAITINSVNTLNGQAFIGGLPWTQSANNTGVAFFSVYDGLVAGTNQIFTGGDMVSGTSSVGLLLSPINSVNPPYSLAGLTQTNLTAGARLIGCVMGNS